jgi:hypothetical protein
MGESVSAAQTCGCPDGISQLTPCGVAVCGLALYGSEMRIV